MSEVWLPIAGYEDCYEVSSLGRIRSVTRIDPLGRLREGRDLKFKNTRGYLRVNLSLAGIQTTHAVHRLVAQTFIPNPDDKPQINHKDADKANNVVSNLEWCTGAENMDHAHNLGLCRGYRHIAVLGVCSTTGAERRYHCMRAAEVDGFQHHLIGRVINGAQKKHKGHYWRLDEDTST